MKNLLGASLITMNHLNFNDDLQFLDQNKAVDYLHVDIMDGVFVPRYGIYPEIIMDISEKYNFILDVHLMVKDVEFAVDQIKHIKNIEYISFHLFSNEGRVFRLVDIIRSTGAKPILVVDLSTNINHVIEILLKEELAGIMFMGIHPGILQQTHRPEIVIKSLKTLKKLINSSDLIIQIDGGFNFKTAKQLRVAGINSFIGGSSSIFADLRSDDTKITRFNKIEKNIEMIRKKIDV